MMPEEQGHWEPAEHAEFSVGDRIRVTSRSTGAVCEGEVAATSCNTGSGETALVVRKDDGTEVCRHISYRSYERWVPAEVGSTEPAPEYRWEDVDPSDLRPGDMARGLDPDGRFGVVTPEAEVTETTIAERDEYIYLAGSGGWSRGRQWQRRVPVTSEPEYTWEPIASDRLREGMYVRGTSLPEFEVRTFEGHVVALRGDNEIQLQPGGDRARTGFMYINRRGWERRVPVALSAEQAQVPEPAPGDRLAEPRVGEVFTRTFDDGRDPRVGCTVRRVYATDYGWRVAYSNAGQRVAVNGIRVCRDGSITSVEGGSPGRFERTAEAAPDSPTGWVQVADLTTLQVGDIVRATPNGIGGRLQARVTRVSSFIDVRYSALTTHVITPSSNGEVVDRTCWGNREGYVYGQHGHNTEVWRGPGEAPAPAGDLTARAGLVREAPIPGWATSLDAARRYVHAEAWRLYGTQDNCRQGTVDFLVYADLPEEESFPPAPDESVQIREFLTKVREAALETADAHGKSINQVRTWLDRHGITEPAPPPPVEYTFTVTAPAGTTREDVISSARQLGQQGWEIR